MSGFEIALLAAALAILFLIAGIAYQAAGSAADRRKFAPLGRMVDIGGRRLHLVDMGERAPPVILESGIAASCLNWTFVEREIAKFTRVCSYDRAWLGWSDPGEGRRLISVLIEELHSLLAAAAIPGPFVLTGHSFGGMLVRAYAVKYPAEVAGLVLVDPLSEREWLQLSEEQSSTLRRGARLSRRGALLARLGIVRASLALLSGGARRLPKLIARMSSGRGETVLSRLVGEVQKMPPETWPLVQAHWRQPKCFRGMGEYLECLPASSAEAAALTGHPPVPVTILSAANSTPRQLAERDAIARASRHGKHTVAQDCGHWIHLDQPQLVIQAVREMVDLVRSGSALNT